MLNRRVVTQIDSSSSDEIYEVVVVIDGERVRASCTCQAGMRGIWCKHRTAVINSLGDEVSSTYAMQLLEERERIESKIDELREERKRIGWRLAEICANPGEL